MKAIFHIGRPKTGSTTLQVFLAENRQALGERGFFYDRIVEEISSQWEYPLAALAQLGELPPDPFVRRMVGLKDLQAEQDYAGRMMRRFEEGLSGAPAHMHTWVASSEHVWPYIYNAERITAFDALLRPHFEDVTYVVHLRRQEDLILSAYSEAVRRGVDQSFDAFVENFLEKGHGNHFRNLRHWIDVVGRERLVVRILERDALVGGDLVSDFCDILGTPAAGLSRPQTHNPSLTQKSLDAFLLINRHIASVQTEDEWRQSLRSALCRAAEHWGGDGVPLALPAELEARIRARLAEPNEKIRKRFFPEREDLFPPKTPHAQSRAERDPSTELLSDIN